MKAWFPKTILAIGFIALAGAAVYLATAGKFAIGNENLWSTGKIFVVISVLTLIFFGITAFLLHLERQIELLEKDINKQEAR
ncbi:hypothetical protein BH09BAC1_BH09BAC1_20380 [soil metagenome]